MVNGSINFRSTLEPVYDEVIGWYDPDIAICPNHPGEIALYDYIESMFIDPDFADLVGDGGAMMQTVKVCGLCVDC